MTKPKPLPDAALLHQHLDYCLQTGCLTWKSKGRLKGKPALATPRRDGSTYGKFMGASYAAHRVIWKMVHGVDPLHIDHINGDPSDNRLVNLRDVTPAENLRNRSMCSNNTSGIIGVSAKGCKWRAAAWVDNKTIVLGDFPTIAEAAAARKAAEKLLGYHENHGKRPARSQHQVAS